MYNYILPIKKTPQKSKIQTTEAAAAIFEPFAFAFASTLYYSVSTTISPKVASKYHHASSSDLPHKTFWVFGEKVKSLD